MCRELDDGGRRCPNQHRRRRRSRADDATRQRAARYARRVTLARLRRPNLEAIIDEQLSAPADADVVRALRLRRRVARRAGDAVAYELLTVRIDAAQLAWAWRRRAELEVAR